MISDDAQQFAGGFGRIITLMGRIAVPVLLFGCDPPSSQNVQGAITMPTSAPAADPQWGVDANIDMGGTQPCRPIGHVDSFQVDVLVFNARDLREFSFSLRFDNERVELTNVEVVSYLLTSAGGTLQSFQWRKTGTGAVEVEARLQPPGPFVSGADTLARLTFKVEAPRSQTGLDIVSASLNGVPIPPGTSAANAQVVIDSTATSGCWMVNSTADAGDLAPGDGICDINRDAGIVECSLRAAVQEANVISGTNRIGFFPLPVSGCTSWQTCPITLASTLTLEDTTGGTTISGAIVDEEGITQSRVVTVTREVAHPGAAFHIASANNSICGLEFKGFSDAITISGDEATLDGKFDYSGDCSGDYP